MKRLILTIVLTMTITANAFDFIVKEDTDHAFPVVLVDETDFYTPETEKKFADTTITYSNITDGNTASAYTDDATLWYEVGDGTGDYKLIMGAGEFTDPGKRYFVKVVVAGCQTYRFSVFTTYQDPSAMATTEGGAEIQFTGTNVHSHLKAADDNVIVDPNTADIWTAGVITSTILATNCLTSDELDTTFIDEMQDDKISNNNVKHSDAWYTKRASGSDPVPVEPDAIAQAGGTANTIVLEAASSATTNAYAPMLIELTSGTGAPANRTIVAYNGTTKVATVNEDWPGAAPDNTTHYKLTGSPTSSLAHEGLAQAGDATTITLSTEAPGTSSITGFIVLRSGTGAPDTQEISSYDGSTKVLTVSGWSGDSPSTDTYYALIPTGNIVSDTPSPAGLTLEEVQWALSNIIGDPCSTANTVSADLLAIEGMVDNLQAWLGEPNQASTAADIAVLETMVDTLEAALAAVASDITSLSVAVEGVVVQAGAVATAGTASSFTLSTAFPATLNYYRRGTVILVEDADTSKYAMALIESYSAARLVTLQEPLPFTPASSDVVVIPPAMHVTEEPRL